MAFRRLAPLALGMLLLASACTSTSGDVDGNDAPDTTAVIGTGSSTTGVPGPTTTGGETSYAGDSAAPEFPVGLDWLNTDTPLTLEQLRGKVVLLDFWTYGCINCIHIIPDLKRLETEYPDELVVIGVHSAKFVNESATDNIRQVILRYDLEHPVVNDRDFAVWQTWGAAAWPTTVVIDPAGNVVGGHSGEGVYEIVKPVIASLVAEFDAAGTLDHSPISFALEKDGQPDTILSFPGKVHVTAGDPRLFIADTGHNRIVVADRVTGEVTAVYGSGRTGFDDGDAASATFAAPQGLALDGDGVTLYVTDTNNHAVRAIDTTTGSVRTLLGTGRQGWPPAGGVAPNVDLASPWDVLVDGKTMYIAMAGHHQIWAMDLDGGVAAPLVGSAREGVLNGLLDQAELAQPSGLAIDDEILYFADSESSSIRYADVGTASGQTGLVAGGDETLFEFGDTDGTGAAARFQHPLAVIVRPDNGNLIVADTYNSRLRMIEPVTREVTTYLGSEQGWEDGDTPRFYEPGGLSIDGDTLYVADTNNHVVRVIDLVSGETSTLILKGIEAFEAGPEDADYRGTIVNVPRVAVAAGSGALVLDITLPAGYQVNEEAPSSAVITIEGNSIEISDLDASLDLTGGTFPVRIPVTFRDGEGSLTADVTVVYCRRDATSLCLIDQVRFVASVTGGGDGNSVQLAHEIVLPEIAGG